MLKGLQITVHIRLKEWRERRDVSLRQLAAQSGVHHMTLYKLETGNSIHNSLTLLKLCGALCITLHQLVEVAKKPRKGR